MAPAPRPVGLARRGVFHCVIQRGFLRAEVMGWDQLVEASGYAALASAALCAWRAAMTGLRTAT